MPGRVFTVTFVILSGLSAWICYETHSWWGFFLAELLSLVLSALFALFRWTLLRYTEPADRTTRPMTDARKALIMFGVGMLITLAASAILGWPNALWFAGAVNAVVSALLVFPIDESEQRWLGILVFIVGIMAMVIAYLKGASEPVYATLIIQTMVETVIAATIRSHGIEVMGPRAHMPT